MKDRRDRSDTPDGADPDGLRGAASGRPLHLVHETWGDHEALLARTRSDPSGRVGRVDTHVMDVAGPNDPLPLERGGEIQPVALAYETYGELNARGDNAILICHALTGSAHAAGVHAREEVPGWWDPLIGPGKPIDTNRWHVISANVFGGCYGSTGPSSLDPRTGRPYGPSFPRFTVRDMVRAQKRLVDRLGVTRLAAVIGGSMGGMQALEWGAMHPEMVGAIAPIAIGARHSAWAIGLNEVARRAITADPAWQGGRYRPDRQPESGLGLARAIAMLSYRSFDSLEAKFGRERVRAAEAEGASGATGAASDDAGDAADAADGAEPSDAGEARSDVLGRMLSVGFEIESYLSYQGVKLSKRFDANTYLYITRAMDDHDLAEGAVAWRTVLQRDDDAGPGAGDRLGRAVPRAGAARAGRASAQRPLRDAAQPARARRVPDRVPADGGAAAAVPERGGVAGSGDRLLAASPPSDRRHAPRSAAAVRRASGGFVPP
ncbi:MAG: homoserine O-acetyltransferase [Trueperaceae bacterium]|nr:homoserine O-acetyltransferase [Trueperaceae bacterium]